MFVLSPNNPNIKNFIEPPIDFYLGIYFFNVTNADAILKGAKPKVEEVGPFAFIEKKRKVDIDWDVFSSTVAYRNNETYFFLQQPGSLMLDTLITTINPVLLGLASMADDPKLPEAAHAVLELYFWRFNMEPFITRSARELLFEGYNEDILRTVSVYTNNPVHATGKFGYFYPKNNSLSHHLKISTGADDIANLQSIVEFDGTTEMSYWKTDYCNRIEGNTAAPFPRPITTDGHLYMFSAGLCRSIQFQYIKQVSMGKLGLYRFGLSESLMAKSNANMCYCTDDFTCRSQMANLGPCKNGAPMVASYPHFYMANQEDLDLIDGLRPDEALHETYVDIEPTTGISLRGIKRVQLNMPFRRYANLPSLSEIREVMFPILWMDNTIEASDEALDLLYSKAILPGVVVTYVCYSSIVLGLIIIVGALSVYAVKKLQYKRKNKSVQEKSNGVKPADDIDHEKPFIERGDRKSNGVKPTENTDLIKPFIGN